MKGKKEAQSRGKEYLEDIQSWEGRNGCERRRQIDGISEEEELKAIEEMKREKFSGLGGNGVEFFKNASEVYLMSSYRI